jgi:integrase
MRFFLLSMVCKSELQDTVWNEVDFETAVWTIPKGRMKRSKAHNVYLSQQMLDTPAALAPFQVALSYPTKNWLLTIVSATDCIPILQSYHNG